MLKWFESRYDDYEELSLNSSRMFDLILQAFVKVYLPTLRNIEGDEDKHARYRGVFKLFVISLNLSSIKLGQRLKNNMHTVMLKNAMAELLAMSINTFPALNGTIINKPLIAEMSAAIIFSNLTGDTATVKSLIHIMTTETPPIDISGLQLEKWIPFNVRKDIRRINPSTSEFMSDGELKRIHYILVDNFDEYVAQICDTSCKIQYYSSEWKQVIAIFKALG